MSDPAQSNPVMAGDKVSDVLARDESLVDVLVQHAPVPLPSGPGVEADTTLAAKHPASATIVELDVREDLRAGREPFSRIMQAVGALADDQVLLLRTIFEPAPLFGVLAKRGFASETVAHAPDDWSSWFWRPEAHSPEPQMTGEPAAAPSGPAAQDDTTIVLDVRGLEPPEPLMRTLAALETLPPGYVLQQINTRVPQLLFPMLAERGFACEVDESLAHIVTVRIWRAR
jgi:uncharacterized protein (DUF2249 family)